MNNSIDLDLDSNSCLVSLTQYFLASCNLFHPICGSETAVTRECKKVYVHTAHFVEIMHKINNDQTQNQKGILPQYINKTDEMQAKASFQYLCTFPP